MTSVNVLSVLYTLSQLILKRPVVILLFGSGTKGGVINVFAQGQELVHQEVERGHR